MNGNNGVIKGMLLILVALYVISPVDAVPGPVDDLLMLLLTAAANMHKGGSSRDLPEDTLEGKWKD